MADGWIALCRSIQDHWLWKDKPFSFGQAWIDLIMLANYEDKKTLYHGKIIVCKRGDVNLSLSELASRWLWDRKKVKRFISLLESDGMVTSNVTKQRTTITLVNYGFFQDLGTTEWTTEGTRTPQRLPQRLPITNNINKLTSIEKENKSKEKEPRSFKPPTLEEVKTYCQERNNNVNAENFVDFYTSKGWMVGKTKMKDWKACVRTWERNERSVKSDGETKPYTGISL